MFMCYGVKSCMLHISFSLVLFVKQQIFTFHFLNEFHNSMFPRGENIEEPLEKCYLLGGVEGSILQYIAKEWPISDANNPARACD